MPNINLIAGQRADKKRLERMTRQLFFGVLAEAAALVLLVSYVGARHVALAGALADANARMKRLQPTLDRIQKIETEMNTLRPKTETLEAAREETQRWRAMLQMISLSVPSRVWLSGLASNTTDGNTVITLTGVASSQTLVGETMTRLGSFPVFEGVDLRFTQLAVSQSGNEPSRVNFEVGAHLKPTQAAQKAQEAAKAAENKSEQAQGGRSNGSTSA